MITQNKYFIGKVQDARDHLTQEEMVQLGTILQKIQAGRAAKNLPANRYIVINAGEHCGREALEAYTNAVDRHLRESGGKMAQPQVEAIKATRSVIAGVLLQSKMESPGKFPD